MKHLAIFLLALLCVGAASAQTAPTITVPPQALTLNPGYPGALTVTATGSIPLSYRWFKNGAALADGGGLTGTLTPTLAIASAQPTHAGTYTVIVSNSAGSVTSDPATLTVAIIYVPAITSALTVTTLPSAPFSYAIAAANDPTSFSATGLPPGLTVDPATGVITGTPTVEGIYPVALGATNAVGTGTATLSLTVENALPAYADKLLIRSSTTGAVVDGQLSAPAHLTVDAAGNLFIADAGAHTIAKASPTGALTIVAGQAGRGGGADGVGTAATFLRPGGVAVDALGNLYVADTGNHTIRKITPDGTVSTLAGSVGAAGGADGAGAGARFYSPQGIAVDAAGTLYVADTVNSTIRKITAAGVVSTLAGVPGLPGDADGTGSAARFNRPTSLALNPAGALYVSDSGSPLGPGRIRKVTAAGVVTTVATGFSAPFDLALDPSGNLFIADTNRHVIKELTAVGTLRTLSLKPVYQLPASPKGVSASSTTVPWKPSGMACDSAGNFYWFDHSNVQSFGLHKAAPFFPVTITTPLQNRTALSGTDATFTVAASGQPLSYAWYGAPPHRDGLTPFPVYLDSTGPSQTVTARLGSDGPGSYTTNAGTYGVVVYNVGSVATSSAGLFIAPEAPLILTEPASQKVLAGQRVTFAVSAIAKDYGGPVTFTYAWLFNDRPIPGATGRTYTRADVQPADAGLYSVIVTQTSFAGGITRSSAPATLTVTPTTAPQIVTAPAALTVRAGGPATLTVAATGTPAPSYQWNFNGSPIPGATAATLTLPDAQTTAAGAYTVTLTNAAGTVTTVPATLEVVTTRLVNLSARGPVSATHALIVGFVTAGAAPKSLLLRGVGPALLPLGVVNALGAPALTLYDARATALATNARWGGTPALTDAFARVGAFTLPASSADTALLTTLAGGLYSAQIGGQAGTSGVALAEIYDADLGTPAPRLLNLSARGFVAPGGDALIAGFVITGNRPARILLRGVGPALAAFAVDGALATPRLTLFDAAGKILATHLGWAGDPALSTAFAEAGAFAFAPTSKDAALVATLPPGSYTAHVSGLADTTGVALVEVYELP